MAWLTIEQLISNTDAICWLVNIPVCHKIYRIKSRSTRRDDDIFPGVRCHPLKVCQEKKTPLLRKKYSFLLSSYQISRKEIIESISDMLLMPILKFEHQSALQQFTHFSRNNNYDLSDLLIAYSAKEQDCKSVLTFDKRASKSGLFELML